MAHVLPWGFKRARGRQLLLSLFLVPFVAAGLLVTSMALDGGRDLDAVGDHRTPLLMPRGATKVRLEGVAHRDSPVSSPTGQRAIGWAGHVAYLQQDSDHHDEYVPVCTRGSFFDVKVTESLRDLPVSFAHPGDALSLGDGLGARLPVLDAGTLRTVETIPAEIAASCQAEIRANQGKKLLYQESLIADGAHVELLACMDARGVAPCRDGHDLLTTGSIAERVAHAGRGVAAFGLFAGLWNLVILSIVALMLLDAMPRGRRL